MIFKVSMFISNFHEWYTDMWLCLCQLICGAICLCIIYDNNHCIECVLVFPIWIIESWLLLTCTPILIIESWLLSTCSLLDVERNGMIDCLDWWFRPLLIYMYEREIVPILEGTCPFVNGPFGMAPSWVGPFEKGNRLMTKLINYYLNWSLILISS